MSVTEPEPAPDDVSSLETPAPPVEAPVMAETDVMDANQRCDSCGAQAYVKTRHGDSDLLWCAHDFHRHEDKLAPLVVLDERSRLTAPLTSSY